MKKKLWYIQQINLFKGLAKDKLQSEENSIIDLQIHQLKKLLKITTPKRLLWKE